MTTKSITSVTEGQKKQVRWLAKDALDCAVAEGILDKDSIQKLIENGNKFQVHIIDGIRKFSLSNQFADEEMESSYGYLSGYKPKGITEQTNRLRQLFPGIGFANEKLAEQPLPARAEGYFAIPRWEKMAPTYPEALLKVLAKINETSDGRFYNWCEGKIDAQHIRQLTKTATHLECLGKEQEGYDILVVPYQFGLRHRGRSVRRAREVMNLSEFGLGAFAVGMMLLTHEDRLKHYDDLWIDCAGDEFSGDGDGLFGHAPYFVFRGVGVGFGTGHVDVPDGGCGSASGFSPQ